MRRAGSAAVRVGARVFGFEEEHDVAELLAQAAERGAAFVRRRGFGSCGVYVLCWGGGRGVVVRVFEVVRGLFGLGRGGGDELRGGLGACGAGGRGGGGAGGRAACSKPARPSRG